MKLKVLLPTEVLVDRSVNQVIAEAENGSFCLLPRHVDFVAGLAPGILAYVDAATGDEEFLAVDEGVLVKAGNEVLVSTRHAVVGPDLGVLRAAIDAHFNALDERERQTRSAVVRLEADFIRRFVEMEKSVRG